jgi:hypothetical protein
MPAKPQQMSDSQEKSDDLIAELAKLMASNAQGSESEPKPTVIKLAPLSEATGPSPTPIRIPGMDAPAAPAAAAPAVRIPGMENPAGVDMPAPAPKPAPAVQQPTTQSDVAKPPMAAPEPLAGGQMSAPAPQAQPVPVPEAAPAPVAAHVEPTISVAAAPAPAEAKPSPYTDPDSFNFDFGFKADGSTTGGSSQGEARHKPAEAPKPAAAPEHDPIADLIAAELDAAQAAPAAPEVPKVEPAPAAAAFPASVEAIPASNFGNTTAGQAPVLIARPAGPPASRATPTAPVAFRPLPQPPKAAESDKFAVAPVFGLGGKPTPAPTASAPTPAPVSERPAIASLASPAAVPAHKPDGDPMDEIESLIGEAVRIELSGPEKPAAPNQPPVQAPAAPVVPPLTTGFAPRRAGLKDNEPQMKSAEAAILAAAAATGAEVGRIDAHTADDRAHKRVKIKPQKANPFGGVRQYVGMAVAGTLLLAAGFGLYWVLGMGRGTGDAPVLTADATPAKQAPAITAASVAEPARSVVFDEIDGVAATDTPETLVSRDETAGTSVTDVARVVTPEAADSTETGLANRKVRTVTVRPDGTIVNGDEAVAGTEALPVERPNVPEVPGAATEPSDLLTAAVATDPVETAAEPAAMPTAELDPIAAAIAGGETVQPDPIDVAALASTSTTPPVFDASIVAPTPMPRPADRNALAASAAPAEIETASAEPNAPAELPLVDLIEPAAQPAAVANSAGGAAAYVQLSSQLNEGDAEAAIRAAQQRWGSLFAGNQLIVQRADLGAKGIRYRVRLPTSSLQDATQICASIKANGGDCFATGS